MVTLRPYQLESVEAVYRHLQERDDNPVVVIPTGGGKTPVMATLCDDAVTRWNGRVLVLAHVKELLEQTAGTLDRMAPHLHVGMYSAGLKRRDTEHPVIVAGIQSVFRRAAELDAFDLVIIDEAHMIPPEGEGMYQTFLKDAKVVNPQLRVIGLTATPFRMTSGMICQSDHFLNHVCFEVGVRELIRDGFLCPLRTKAGITKADTSGLHVRGGEFVAGEVENLMDQVALVRAACSEIVEQTQDRTSVLIFSSGIQHGQHIVDVLRSEHGVECGFITGETPADEREALIARFRRQGGRELLGSGSPLKFLCNVNVLTTGFDAPNVDCVAMLRPTMSPGLYYQMVGRGFRLCEGKADCLVLDFGGNVLRHGPVDQVRVTEPQGDGTGEAPAKECPECHALIHAAYGKCPECGYVFPPPERQQHGAEATSAGIPSGQRNGTLARLAGGMRRMGMSETEITVALTQVNRARCAPPLEDAEVRRIAASVARYEPDAVSVALAENHYEQDRQPATVRDAASDDPGAFPEALLNVPGFVGELADYTLRTAPYPQPILAFAGALSCQAFLAGRRVRDISDSRTNLYVLALANSGAGKDHPRKINQRVLLAAELHECLGDKFASGEGIEDRLFTQPSMLFQTDEIDGLMQAINRANDARHEGILNVLLKMYTSGNALYPMRVKAGKDAPGVIDQPSLCMLGTAVPRYYYEALSMRMLNNGFFARLLILEASKRGSGQDPCTEDLPERIVETARWWAQYTPGGGGDLSKWHPRPTLVPETPGATAVFRDLRTEADVRYAAAEERDDPTAMAIWARAYEKARKLALIYTVSATYTNPQITETAARWAWAMVDYQTRRMLFMAAQHVAEGEFDGKCKRMTEVLTAWAQRRGDAWMPHWDLSRRLKWSDRELDEVRDALLGQERICFEVGSTARGGRSGQKYRLAPGSAVPSSVTTVTTSECGN